MDLNDYTSRVHDQLLAAASLGDERTQQIAGTLGAALDSAVRLALLDAVAAVTDEVTAALFEASGGQSSPAVTAQLSGEDVRISVAAPLGPDPEHGGDTNRAEEGEATARISLRLSEALKAQIEAAAAQAEVSVNTWLVRMAGNAVNESGSNPRGGGWSGWPGANWGGANWGGANWGGAGPNASGRVTGWVTG